MGTKINEEMIFAPCYGSFIPILLKVLSASKGPVLEIGTGVFSTPIMHWLCLEQKRELVSYENDLIYFNAVKTFESSMHQIKFINDWNDIPIDKTHWSVALIDHAPAIRRKEEIKRLANLVDYIVVHDTEKSQNHHYHYDEIYPLFKYRYNYKRQRPYTTVLSNFKELTHLRG